MESSHAGNTELSSAEIKQLQQNMRYISLINYISNIVREIRSVLSCCWNVIWVTGRASGLYNICCSNPFCLDVFGPPNFGGKGPPKFLTKFYKSGHRTCGKVW